MFDLNALLAAEGVAPTAVLIMRHRPIEPAIAKVLPWIVTERPDLFLTYQHIQWPRGEKALSRAKYLASFLGGQTGKATFAGLYEVGAATSLTYEAYHRMPGNVEMIAMGMTGRQPEDADQLCFDLKLLPTLKDWIGRLIITWPPPERAWFRWADRNQMPVHAILEESIFSRGMPAWEDIVLNWAELRLLPASWRAALAQWRGVYFIFDVERQQGYVGSAYGADNILGRWVNYAQTGHGGNKLLRGSRPEDLRFSILERTSPDLDPALVIAKEGQWKLRLHTRDHGLNDN